MILKTFSHDYKGSDCWSFYDNIVHVNSYYDYDDACNCVSLKFKDERPDMIVKILEPAYLCNDFGRTIEKLYPASDISDLK